MILQPVSGQNTNDPSPRRFARGTVPQYRLSKELLKLSPHAKYSSGPIVTTSGRPSTGCSRTYVSPGLAFMRLM